MAACQLGNFEAMQTLVERGANLNVVCSNGYNIYNYIVGDDDRYTKSKDTAHKIKMINYLAQHHVDYQLYVSQAIVAECRDYMSHNSLDKIKFLVEQIPQPVELTDALMIDIFHGIACRFSSEGAQFKYFLQHKPDFFNNLTDEQIGNVLNNTPHWKPGYKYLTNYYKELGRVITL